MDFLIPPLNPVYTPGQRQDFTVGAGSALLGRVCGGQENSCSQEQDVLLGRECIRQAGAHFPNLTLAPAVGPYPCPSGTAHSSALEDRDFRCLVFLWRRAAGRSGSLGSNHQTMTEGSWRINTPVPLSLRWDSSESILHSLPGISVGLDGTLCVGVLPFLASLLHSPCRIS